MSESVAFFCTADLALLGICAGSRLKCMTRRCLCGTALCAGLILRAARILGRPVMYADHCVAAVASAVVVTVNMGGGVSLAFRCIATLTFLGRLACSGFPVMSEGIAACCTT